MEKGHAIVFFGRLNTVVLTELVFFFFDQLWAWQQGVFHEKVEIMT